MLRGEYGVVEVVFKRGQIFARKEGSISNREVNALIELSSSGLSPDFHSCRLSPEYHYCRDPYANRIRFNQGSTLIMEYLEGWENVSVKEPTEEVIKNFFHQLKNLHLRGFCHGDMHGDNVMVNADNEVKFVDFGVTIRNYREALYEAINILEYFVNFYYESIPFLNVPIEILESYNFPVSIKNQLIKNGRILRKLMDDQPWIMEPSKGRSLEKEFLPLLEIAYHNIY